ncbi:MAG TPA: exodeoxyribonuclease VII large subunit, partial [Pyrinomonadaceae bacterium]|nr:exodeoxyribonuclease VII large subunit [Pyrinomonadaceae bacterium]
FEQIKAKLAAEGLFDEELKRRLPLFPKRVGVVTSPNGAAFFDILHVLSRRARSISVLLIPTRVQGETAGDEICQAVRAANEFNRSALVHDRIEVLIVGRGGGSSEDLWAFNEEHVARAIRESEIPVISAVGHEIDFTIADFAADLRAPTPSAAAEIVAQREEDILAFLERRENDLGQILGFKLLEAQAGLQSLAMSPVFVEFPGRVREHVISVENLDMRLRDAASARVETLEDRLEAVSSQLSPLQLASKIGQAGTRFALLTQRHRTAAADMIAAKSKSLKLCMATLDALSPLAVLNRGFSITEDESGEILRDAAQTGPGRKLSVRLAKGRIEAEVLSTDPK